MSTPIEQERRGNLPDGWLMARELEDWAFSQKQGTERSKVLKAVREYALRVVEVCRLWDAFQQSPRRALEGEKGVEGAIGMSKSAIHLLIKDLRLKPTDFRQASATLHSLIADSDTIQQLLEELRELHAQHCGAYPRKRKVRRSQVVVSV